MRQSRLVPRQGLTLIELLVVIGIMGLLFALTTVAVQRARDSGARTRCQNNLRQIGHALHLYHDGFQRLPSGLTVDRLKATEPFLSWNARILPFLGAAALWSEIQQAFQQDRNFLTVPPHTRRGDIIPAFSCPSDARVWEEGHKSAFTSYLGVEGTDQYRQDGVLYMDSRTRLLDVRDGTSNTLMVGERPPSADLRLGWWYAGWGQAQDGSAEMVLGVREFNVWNHRECPDGPYHFGPGRFSNQCDTYHFWSPHFGGCNFLFADGSVRRLAYTVDRIMPALATRAGGEAAEWTD